RLHQGARGRDRAARHHGERDRARADRHAAAQALGLAGCADPGHRCAEPDQADWDARGHRGGVRLPGLRGGELHDRPGAEPERGRVPLAVERSEARILTTHAGSLPRTPELTALLVRRSRREPFMTAPSPGIIAAAMTNEHYPRLEDYVHALATALRTEYEHIVAQGFVLQIDCPDLAMERHTRFADRPLAEFLAFMELVVGAINAALANIPRERVRLHVCWGNYNGPHLFDVPLEEIIARLYAARVGALVLSMA